MRDSQAFGTAQLSRVFDAGNTNQRRRLYLKGSVKGQYYGTIAITDDAGTASYNGLYLQLQKRLKKCVRIMRRRIALRFGASTDWQLSAILKVKSGRYFTVTLGGDVALNAEGGTNQ